MEIPPVFADLCSIAFHQDFAVVYSTFENAFLETYRNFSSSQQIQLLSFLQNTHESNLTNLQLEDVWNRCGADIYFEDASMREVFGYMLNIIKE